MNSNGTISISQTKNDMEKYITDSLDAFVSHAVHDILSAHDGGCIGLSGGSTPREVYAALGQKSALSQTTFLSVDERYVPATDDRSNMRLWRDTLGEDAHIMGFDTSLAIPDSLSAFGQTLHAHLPMDVCILGMGIDGHTASLFPHSVTLHSQELVAHTETEVFDVHDRLTMTFIPIMASKRLVLLLRGADKRTSLETLLHGSASRETFPAKTLLDHPELHIVYLEK